MKSDCIQTTSCQEPPAFSSHAPQGELGGHPLPRGSNLPRAHTRSSAWGCLSLTLPWVLPTISGSILPESHPKRPSLRLQPLMSRPFQLDLRLCPPSSLLWLPYPPALWNEFTKVPLCLPGTLPFCKSWARMGVWRRAGPAVITAGPFEVSSRNTRASSRWA